MKFTKHPVLKAPTPDEIRKLCFNEDGSDREGGLEALIEMHRMHEEAVENAESDPLDCGVSLPQQLAVEELIKKKTEVWVFGGNRSGKSHNAAKMVMKALLGNPGTLIVCWAQDKDASIEMQQPYLAEMLPADLKGRKIAESVTNINYNEKSGFTGQKFVLPNGSKCLFKFYSQFANNEKMIEGYKLGCRPDKCTYANIGTWPDEYYGDDKLIKRLYRRCADFDASLLISFTPLDGHTPTVARMLGGAEIVESWPTDPDLLPNTPTMPYIMQPTKASAGVVFFHTLANPFTNSVRFKADLQDETEEEIKTLAYGFPTKSMTSLFPLFSESVHVIDQLPKITKNTHTVYQIIDPAGARNFSVIWAAVDKLNHITVLREWPDRDTFGEWALFGDPKWKHGPASKKIGYAIKTDVKEYSYIELFKEIEKELGVEVFERIGDSRFMAVEHENQDMFSDFAEKDMHVVPSDGRDEKAGIQLLDQWFTYNQNIEVDSINRPIIQFHKSCGNVIDSVTNYGMNGKADEALKDFIDCLRYLRTANGGEGPEHYSPEAFTSTSTVGGY